MEYIIFGTLKLSIYRFRPTNDYFIIKITTQSANYNPC